MTDRDVLNCDLIFDSGLVCFTKLGETVDSSWQHVHDQVRDQIAHWHCCSTKRYWNEQIRTFFDVSLTEFHSESFVRLNEILMESERGKEFLCSRSAAELEEQCRRCILASFTRVRDKYRRDKKRVSQTIEFRDDIFVRDNSEFDTWYIRHELIQCLKSLDDLDRHIFIEVRIYGRPQKDVAAELNKHSGTVGRTVWRVEEALRLCLSAKGIRL
jgi:hypothetical protein